MSATNQELHHTETPHAFRIHFPAGEGQLDQDEEFFEFTLGEDVQRLRIHDYAALYKVPGLYEALVYDKLECKSPARLARLFGAVIDDWGVSAESLRALDLGAGNGVVAQEFHNLGVHHLVGVDLLSEAKSAAQRDRPHIYADYLVTDLCNLSKSNRERLARHQLNCLLTVAALGFGDIPPRVFAAAFNSITPTGWLGMTIKEEFMSSMDSSGFAEFLQAMVDHSVIDVLAYHRYCHRRSISGDKLFYIALVAKKQRNITAGLLKKLDHTTSSSTQQSSQDSVIQAS